MAKNEWFKVKKSGFLEGTIIATLAIIITKIMGMLYVIPFYAMVGEKGSALYAYAYNIYIIFLDISSAGLPIAISKIIKEYNTLKMYDAKMRAYKIGKKIVTVLSICIFILLFLFARPIATLILGDLTGGNTIDDVTFVIRAVSFAILVVPYLSVSKGFLQGHNIINISSISQVIEQIARIAVILGGSYIALNILHLSLRTTIGIAVFGACAGGLFAVFYILTKMHKNQKELGFNEKFKKDKVTDKEIAKKIITYSIPFIVIAIAASINNFMDMVMILRTLEYMGIETSTIEFATTAITTWSAKISMIVNSIALGMTTSLIPTIVEAFTLKNWNEVNNKLNKALQFILVICIPMCVGLSLLSKSVWSVFYGVSNVGAVIFSIHIFVSLFFNLFTITSSTLQSLNKFKAVYKSTITGFLTNISLNIPLMVLFKNLGLAPYLGAILATACGYIVSFVIALKILKKEHHLHYEDTIKTFFKILIPTIMMIIVVVFLKMIIPINLASKVSCIIYIGLISIIGAITYLGVSYKMGILEHVFGHAYLNKIIKKLTFGKISI